jgi:hypothetical protein
MSKLGLKTKFILGFSMLFLLGMGLTGTMTFKLASKIVENLAMESMQLQLKSIEASIRVLYQDSLEREKRRMGIYLERYGSHFTVSESSLIEQEVENQVTHVRQKIKLPQFLFDGHSFSGHELVDRIKSESGSEVTFFVAIPDGLVRVSTSIHKTDGTRAEWTYIPSSSPSCSSRNGCDYRRG